MLWSNWTLAIGRRTIKTNKLFWGASTALLTTAFCFTVIAGIAFSVKQEFVLTNAQLGMFTGVFFVGFTISQAIFAPFCDSIGIRWIMRAAFVGHVSGALFMMLAQGYDALIVGSLLAGMGAGFVEAGGNPLVTALFPDNKTTKLNRFHIWFPYGNLIAAVILTVVFKGLDIGWRGQLFLILIPAAIYGVMLMAEEFPPTEGAQAGITLAESVRALFAPIMLLMVPLMVVTASMELPPSSWVPPVLQAGGVNGLLVFGFVFGIMGTLRFTAGPVIRLLTPTGVLLGSSILGTLGLYLFSYAETTFMAFATAAIWAVGIAYFWPTMLGFVSERNPKSGALGLGVMGAVGMLASFYVTPWLGSVADREGHTQIPEAATVELFRTVSLEFPLIAVNSGEQTDDILAVASTTQMVLESYTETGVLPEGDTAQALRSISTSGVDAAVVSKAAAILNPADNYGGRISFRTLAPIGFILIAVFGFLLVQDRRRGGYKAVDLSSEQ
jgi:MFS family permease